MTRHRRSWLALALASLLAPGCGLIYTHVTIPLDDNLSGQHVHLDERELRSGQGDTRHLAINGLAVDWGDRGVGALATRFHMEKVAYADLEVLSVLGVWRQQWVHLYGE